MFILPDSKTPVLFQGITSESGLLHLKKSLDYGTNVVAGISAQTRHKSLMGVPVFSHISQAMKKFHPQVSVIFSTPPHALDDVLAAVKAKIPLVICTTEHVPMHDSLKMKWAAQKYGVVLLGPSSNGIISVDDVLVGTLPPHLFQSGSVGIISRSGSLVFEAIQLLKENNLGISKCITLGTDHLIATDFIPVVQALLKDKKTNQILIIGQVHGQHEYELASFLKKCRTKKKIYSYIPGKTLIRSDKLPLLGMQSVLFSDVISKKNAILKAAGVYCIDSVDKIGSVIRKGERNK